MVHDCGGGGDGERHPKNSLNGITYLISASLFFSLKYTQTICSNRMCCSTTVADGGWPGLVWPGEAFPED